MNCGLSTMVQFSDSHQMPDVQIAPTLLEILGDKPAMAMVRLVLAAKQASRWCGRWIQY
jgi:hypothetical protein